jgi:hypothetical protein
MARTVHSPCTDLQTVEPPTAWLYRKVSSDCLDVFGLRRACRLRGKEDTEILEVGRGRNPVGFDQLWLRLWAMAVACSLLTVVSR